MSRVTLGIHRKVLIRVKEIHRKIIHTTVSICVQTPEGKRSLDLRFTVLMAMKIEVMFSTCIAVPTSKIRFAEI